VVLFQLGGPDSLEAVEPFLYNLFSDPDIIDFPLATLARKPLAKFISSRRSKKVAEHYREIGGKSPILELTNQQASSLQKRLAKSINAQVFVAMRYWNPLTDIAAANVASGKFDRVVLLPLYPQYSVTTSGSSINEWNRCFTSKGVDQKLIHHFYDHPKYIDAVVENVEKALGSFRSIDRSKVTLIFSAHGLPLSVIQKGDPYQDHIEQTVQLVIRRGRWKSPHVLCYQSKVGGAKWLSPSLHQTIHNLAGRGVKHVLVIPVAFLTDHVETLHEINVEAKEDALRLGITNFVLMPALNDHPKLIEALADEILKKAREN
jgi:ferrochelatase